MSGFFWFLFFIFSCYGSQICRWLMLNFSSRILFKSFIRVGGCSIWVRKCVGCVNFLVLLHIEFKEKVFDTLLSFSIQISPKSPDWSKFGQTFPENSWECQISLKIVIFSKFLVPSAQKLWEFKCLREPIFCSPPFIPRSPNLWFSCIEESFLSLSHDSYRNLSRRITIP